MIHCLAITTNNIPRRGKGEKNSYKRRGVIVTVNRNIAIAIEIRRRNHAMP